MPYLRTNYPDSCRKALLTAAEYLVLTTMRLWVGRDSNEPPGCPWDEGIRVAGLGEDAVQAFHGLASILGGTTCRDLEFYAPGCECIGNDEGLFLEALGLLQYKQFEGAKEILGYWLPPAAIRLAIPPAARLANALLSWGLVIPYRDPPARTGAGHDAVIPARHGRFTIN